VTALTVATAARAAQLVIRARMMRDAAKLWPVLDPKRLDQTFPSWLRAMMALIGNYHGQSSQAAGAFYRAARAEATQSPAPGSLIRIAPAPAEQWMSRALGYAGPGMLERDTARPGTALTTTLGTSSRIVLDGGRSTVLATVKADPVAVGYFRVTDGDPCAFCALLAGRGIVYKADTANFQSHNDCGCYGAPAFDRDQELPAISQEADRIYQRGGDGPALQVFRKNWDARKH